jgi:hypothetical protein
MAAEVATSRQPQRPRAGWRQWLRWVVAAALLLALSQALWLWQTWPVRELLQSPPPRSTGTR